MRPKVLRTPFWSPTVIHKMWNMQTNFPNFNMAAKIAITKVATQRTTKGMPFKVLLKDGNMNRIHFS